MPQNASKKSGRKATVSTGSSCRNASAAASACDFRPMNIAPYAVKWTLWIR
jgi:hypothetical protein